MRLVFSQPRYGLTDLLKHTFISSMVVFFSMVTVDIATRKEDVVIDENYRGKYVKVMHYKSFNRDSLYRYYYKPKIVKVDILYVMKQNNNRYTIKIQDGEYTEYVNDVNRIYRKGQKVTLRKKFYPSVKYNEYN